MLFLPSSVPRSCSAGRTRRGWALGAALASARPSAGLPAPCPSCPERIVPCRAWGAGTGRPGRRGCSFGRIVPWVTGGCPFGASALPPARTSDHISSVGSAAGNQCLPEIVPTESPGLCRDMALSHLQRQRAPSQGSAPSQRDETLLCAGWQGDISAVTSKTDLQTPQGGFLLFSLFFSPSWKLLQGRAS